MPTELPKQFDPAAAQARWLKFWEDLGIGHSEPDPNRKPFTIVIPPPNVTGALHLGHGINNTLQDVIIRFRRMQGYNAAWFPGTDHAGIATQAVVERRIFELEKKTRHDLGREALVARIWEWKDQYEARILHQFKQLGFSCDWQRTRFTLDEQCTKAVRRAFFELFKNGLIFRGKRLVNWDPVLQTSVADDETYTEETKGGFWTFKYEVTENPGEFIRFSTTRPETMLGDTALCVHPGDERYKHLIGKTVTQPLVGRRIPIIADGQLADPTLGTGCVKVTPAHDPNDYACWLRNPHIGMVNIMNKDGTIGAEGGRFAGMDRYKARDAVVAAMTELGLFEGREDRLIPLKFSDRSKSPIEPLLSDQWFVKMGDHADGRPGLAQFAMDAVTAGDVRFFPERYAKSYLDWLGEKRDWCISRQLWWGHRIPVWYWQGDEAALRRAVGARDDVTWQRDAENDQWLICPLHDATELVSSLNELGARQDADVLDTWFSSALWPLSTMGWPEKTPELAYYYPTDVLVTNRDIITLWVARMVIMGQFNVGQVPFRHVYIHPKILDGFGEGMSKSKGNGVDPLDIVAMYGTDALRFGLCQLATETQDARMPVTNVCPHCQAMVPVRHEHMYMKTKRLACPSCKKPFRPGGPWTADDPELPTAKQSSERFELGRNFATKLWNAARFLLMNLDGYEPAWIDSANLPIEDHWILSRLTSTIHAVTDALENYRIGEATRLLYDFTWSEFCDWYVEMAKLRLREEGNRPHAQRMLVGVLDTLLRLLHPIMPFVTESIWSALNEAAPRRGLPDPLEQPVSVALASWPDFPKELMNPGIEKSIGRMQEIVRSIRNIRNQFRVDEKELVEVTVACDRDTSLEILPLGPAIVPLARVKKLHVGPDWPKPSQAASTVHGDFTCYVHLQGLIDVAAEIQRLQKQLVEKEKALAGVRAKLGNAAYLAKAAPEVVQQSRDLEAELLGQLASLKDNLRQLQEAS